MRYNKDSQEGSQEAKRRDKVSQNVQSEQNYLYDEDPINCPLIFKAVLLALITIGILAFIITFALQVQNSSELYPEDFNTCGDNSNVLRLSKYYAYEKMILGLSISGLVLAFGLAVFLIRHAYDFCRCYDDCYERDSQASQQESESENTVEADKKPKKQTQEAVRKVRNPHILQYLKPVKQIRQIDKKYNQNGGNSDQIDCECNDIGSCLACCASCLWWRTCFEAHHYRFYKSKNQQYAFWIVYLLKTLLFGTALAYVIRMNVSFDALGWCTSLNAKTYDDFLYNSMVIGITTFCVDIFGYVHLLVEGSLLQVIEDTLNTPQKSQHSEKSSSDDEFEVQSQKKKKYQNSQSQSEGQKPKKKKKPAKKLSQQAAQISSSQEIPTKLNLISSMKKDKTKQPIQPQEEILSAKDTDSFFIKIKTLGNKFINDIGNQEDEDESEQSKKKEKAKKVSKKSSQPLTQSQESYESSNKKPDIFVPKNFDKLPKFETKKTTMVRENESVKQKPFWESQLRNKNNEAAQLGTQIESQKESEFKWKKPEEKPIPNIPTKFGAFNRDPQNSKAFGKDPIKIFVDEKESKMDQFQKLSKFSTKF